MKMRPMTCELFFERWNKAHRRPDRIKGQTRVDERKRAQANEKKGTPHPPNENEKVQQAKKQK